jgi:Protein of unknown function (DUF2442)
MFLHVVKADYLRDYKLRLFFNDGAQKIVNLEDELYGEVFEPLKNMENFKQFFISHNTIEWENGADFDPEFLYNKASIEANQYQKGICR